MNSKIYLIGGCFFNICALFLNLLSAPVYGVLLSVCIGMCILSILCSYICMYKVRWSICKAMAILCFVFAMFIMLDALMRLMIRVRICDFLM